MAAATADRPAASAADGAVIGGQRRGAAGTQVASGAPEPPATNSVAWIVADQDSGAVLAARNAHRRLPPASTLKTPGTTKPVAAAIRRRRPAAVRAATAVR